MKKITEKQLKTHQQSFKDFMLVVFLNKFSLMLWPILCCLFGVLLKQFAFILIGISVIIHFAFLIITKNI